MCRWWTRRTSRGQNESGLEDTVASQFFSPKAPSGRGWIWGRGAGRTHPVRHGRGSRREKWGLGPTGVVLKQVGPWTLGALANHIWSVADSRADVNATFLQPFVSYITPSKTTIGLNTESTYDWENEERSVPVNLTISQLLKLGPQVFQIGLGARYWFESPDFGPEDWGVRGQLTLLFPQ